MEYINMDIKDEQELISYFNYSIEEEDREERIR